MASKAKNNSKTTKAANKKAEKKETAEFAKKLLITLVSITLVLVCAYGALRIVSAQREEQRQEILNSGIFHDGITVSGIAIGGMTMNEAKEALNPISSAMVKDIIFTLTVGRESFNVKSSDIGIIANTEDILTEAMLLGREGSLSDMQDEIEHIKENGHNFTLSLILDTAATNKYLDTISKTLGDTPTDASFTVKEIPLSTEKDIDTYNTVNIGLPEDGSVTDLRDLRFDFVEAKDGIKIDREKLIAILTERINTKDFSSIEIPAEIIPAAITIADLKEKLVLRSTVSTSFSSGSGSRKERVHNMTKATSLIYGTVLQPDEQFSANTILGYRTLESGWQMAPAVINGGAATEDQPGGGVCQVSSTVYQAVLMANYQVDHRQGHSSKLGYVEGGLDATIDSGRIDFTWTNNTSSPVYVFTWIDKENKQVWCELYGEPFSGEFDEIKLISEEQDPIEPTATEYIQSTGLAAPYWSVRNAAKKGYVFKTYQSFIKDGKEIDRKLITTTTYRMHPKRINVWQGYLGEPLLPEFEIKAAE